MSLKQLVLILSIIIALFALGASTAFRWYPALYSQDVAHLTEALVWFIQSEWHEVVSQDIKLLLSHWLKQQALTE